MLRPGIIEEMIWGASELKLAELVPVHVKGKCT